MAMITSRIINQIYCNCIATSKEKSVSNIQVNGITQRNHVFNKERIEKEINRILAAITKLPVSFRYSFNPDGKAWITARNGDSSLSGMSLQTTERLISMGIALKIMRIVPHDEILCDIPFIVIDDARLHRIEMTKPRLQRNWALVKWRIFNS